MGLTTSSCPIKCTGSHLGVADGIAEPPKYNVTNEEVLETFEINEECLIHLIHLAKQPTLLNVQTKLYRDGHQAAADSGDGDD
ncbi:hypothetical protein ACHAXR_003396 [Thalassiosira sp. AJA248-18]